MMITVESVIILLSIQVVSVLSTEHCPSTKQFSVTWPQIPVRTKFTKDCSEINSSWTGDFAANCVVKRGGNISWHFKGSCEFEQRSVLQYFTEKVSKVDQSNFLATVTELVNSERNFTNKEKFRGFLNKLKRSVCDRPPALKSEQWDRIHLYCETTLTAVRDKNRSSHFAEYLCQKVQRSSVGDNVLVGDSFTGSTRDGVVGERVVVRRNNSAQAVNISSVIMNKNFSTDGCDFKVKDGQLIIKATKGKATITKIRNNLELCLICVSLVAIICSLVTLSCVRIHSSEKVFVHKNLLLAWALGYIVYILDVKAFTKREKHLDICTATAVTRHFFHTAVFTWMLVEAINLYIKLVKVISRKTFYMTYLAVGWGIPAVIVGITAAVTKAKAYDMNQIQYKDFMCGSIKFTARLLRSRCWLEGSKWIYAGPVLGILLVNLVLFVILLKVVLGNVASKYDNDKLMKTRKGLKGVATLLPMLGVTWLLGFLIDFHEVLAFSFVFLTSIQGVVFCVLHCILDDQVRNSLTQRFRRAPINTQFAT